MHIENEVKQNLKEKNCLAKNLNKVTLNRLVNCLDGIFDGVNKDYYLNFYQPGGDKYGVSSIFPTIFMNYFMNGKLPELIKELNAKIEKLKIMLPREYMNVEGTSGISIKAVKLLNGLYGDKWNDINLLKYKDQNKFSEIAYYMTKEDVGRILAEYSELRKSKEELNSYINSNISGLSNNLRENLECAIKDVIRKSSIDAKSIFETAFYYSWGELCNDDNAIGIGLDTDHNLFQNRSFGLGYSGDYNEVEYPLVYARKDMNPTLKKLQKVSFRQFWYHDGFYNS